MLHTGSKSVISALQLESGIRTPFRSPWAPETRDARRAPPSRIPQETEFLAPGINDHGEMESIHTQVRP